MQAGIESRPSVLLVDDQPFDLAALERHLAPISLRLEQVVTNLVSNALKFGAGRVIHLRVEERDGLARLTVRDEGIGMDSNMRGRLFGRFERGVSDRHYGGLGLGLFITKEAVEAMGGTVRVESELGHGATFTVELPCAPGQDA